MEKILRAIIKFFLMIYWPFKWLFIKGPLWLIKWIIKLPFKILKWIIMPILVLGILIGIPILLWVAPGFLL